MYSLFNPKTKKFFQIELGIIIFLLFLITYLGISQANTSKQITSLNEQNTSLNSQIRAKQIKLNKEASDQALSNADREIKVSALQVQSEKSATKLVNKLFPILLNYSSGKSYAKRKELSKPYLSKNVLESNNIFANDDIAKDTSYIDEIGLHSRFKSVGCSVGLINDNHVPLTILTSYESWESGLRHGVGQDIYEGEYNITTGKLDKLVRLSNLYAGRANQSEDN